MEINIHDYIEEHLDRYPIECCDCSSITWFDNDEEVPVFCKCWRCGEYINEDL